MLSTPVLLITFNRPDHTRLVLETIMAQSPKDLYIFQDGPRKENKSDRQKWSLVQEVIKSLTSYSNTTVHCFFSEKNLGCGPGPAAGISWFFEYVDKGIIIEDDAVPHPDFFLFAEELLEKYKDDKDVCAIGSMHLDDRTYGDGSYYFSKMNRTLCAWATWKRAWNDFDLNLRSTTRADLNNALRKYGTRLREREYWCERLAEIHKDCYHNSSWDQQFWMSIWLRHRKGIMPNVNLSSNIGFDKDATHTTDANSPASCKETEGILPILHPSDTTIQRVADQRFQEIYFAPFEYGWSGFKRFPYRLNKRLKRLLHHEGPWLKHTLTFLVFIAFSLISINTKGANVVFRFDDYRLVPDMIQDQVIECFIKHNIPLSIAIIPFNDYGESIFDSQTVSKISALSQAGELEVCLHGYSHNRFGATLGEMCAYSDNEQCSKISQGKQYLESLLNIDISTFIPPFNAYNAGTLHALEDLGFTAISSGLYPGQSLTSNRLNYYPETLCNEDDIPGAMKEAFKFNNNREGIIVCMLHSYDISDKFTINDLDKFLSYISTIDGVQFVTYKDLVAAGDICGTKRIKANMESNLLTKTIKTKYIILPTWRAIALRVLNIFIYLAVMAVLFIPSFFLRRHLPSRIYQIVGLSSSVMVFFIVWMHLLTPLKAMFIAILFPVAIFVTSVILQYRRLLIKK